MGSANLNSKYKGNNKISVETKQRSIV